MFIAGIDGGGTHSRIEIRDMENQKIRCGQFGPFNINAIGQDAFRGRLREIFDWCGDMENCAGLCIGAAGVSNPKMKEILSEELSRRGFCGKYKLCGDQEIALRGALDGPGLAVIAGTGSVCIGKNAAGEIARSGGFGHIIDDGGSGYALGRDVLSCAARISDGRMQDHGMLSQVLDRLGGGPDRIVPFVFDASTDKAAIARFSGIAIEQAEKGDPEALRILEKEAEELVDLVRAVQKRLDIYGCQIALLGGLLNGENLYRRIVVEKLSVLGVVTAPAHNALWGAAQMAWEL